MRKDPSPARFWSKVDFSADCWIWTAYRDRGGYGRFTPTGDISRPAHRVAYQLLVGAIPDGMTLDHLCRNRACVNPDHLEPVPNRTNVLRGVGITALNAGKTQCIRGHEFDAKNTYRRANGQRVCRACDTIYKKAS